MIVTIGEAYKIVENFCGHGFPMGETVKITEEHYLSKSSHKEKGGAWLATSQKTSSNWWVYGTDIKPVSNPGVDCIF